ncbi:MAG: phosphoglycerate kinase [Gemmatimonadota bacterium]
MIKKTLADVDATTLRGRTVIVRADLNVPLDDGTVADDQRIEASLPSLEHLNASGARCIVLSHLGRPKGAPNPDYSLAPVAERLGELLGRPVSFVPYTSGPQAAAALDALPDGVTAVLENTRYEPGETKNDAGLAEGWAALGDLFVNDAFGTAHRAHASTEGLARAMRERGGEAVAGHLLATELRFLEESLRMPERPFVAIVGGAKISSKIGVISALLPRVDRLLIGGAMANTFFRALGLDTGESLVEEDAVDVARKILEEGGERLVLPTDCVIADELSSDAPFSEVDRDAVSGAQKIFDIGPKTRELFAEMVRRAETVVWNGPMGVFEVSPFDRGTVEVAEAIADACDSGAMGILGGGDSAAAAERAGVVDRLTHVSTGGGASLELLAGGELPAVDALTPRS